MTEFFLTVVNMSISAGWIVLAVLLLRLLFKKAPKWLSVQLWGIVALRLVCPFSIESALSLIPSAQTIDPEVSLGSPEINSGVNVIDTAINPIISDTTIALQPEKSVNLFQFILPYLAGVWILGICALLIYTVVSYLRIKKKVGAAVLYRDNIYQSENVVSPFVLGIIKPKIYLPFSINEKDIEFVLAHEKAHIRRKDHLWKPVGFLLLTLHWFNPLIWLGYILLCRDIELACDEKVIKELDRHARADYSEALLNCSVNRRMIAACPLAFGEVGVKGRIRSVLNYKKPAFWIIIAAIIVCIAVAVCFLTDPKKEVYGETDTNKLNPTQNALMEQYPEYFGLDASNGLDVYVWQMAERSYSFGLLPHTESPRDHLSEELLKLKGVNTGQMREILATYNVSQSDIYVVPWQNPISSFLGDYWVVLEGESLADKQKAYIERVRKMLFDENNISNHGGIDTPTIYRFTSSDGDSEKEFGVYIVGYGCSTENAEIYFQNTRFENNNLIFDILWLNKGDENIEIGPDFEIYKHNGYLSSIKKLDPVGVWNLNLQILAPDSNGSESRNTVSYDLTSRFGQLDAGHYRFESHGAWVDFVIMHNISTASLTYDVASFDIDGDGVNENCSMRRGYTSGLFTFIFLVQDMDTGETEYETTIYSQVYDLAFHQGDKSGKIRVRGVTQGANPEIHLFDISIKDGNVHLTENGIPIGEIN